MSSGPWAEGGDLALTADANSEVWPTVWHAGSSPSRLKFSPQTRTQNDSVNRGEKSSMGHWGTMSSHGCHAVNYKRVSAFTRREPRSTGARFVDVVKASGLRKSRLVAQNYI